MNFRPAYVGTVAAVLAIVVSAAFWIAGSVVVHDNGGEVLSAAVTNGGGETQPLRRLPGGYYYAVPRMEGSVELRCRDGSRERWGYVTRHMHSWARVEPGRGCGRIAEVR